MAHKRVHSARFAYTIVGVLSVTAPLQAADRPRILDNVPENGIPSPAYKNAPYISPFTMEGGTRYWFSRVAAQYSFSNGSSLFGDPTSTLDWNKMTGHTVEAFARIDHRSTGLFVKGLLGMGRLSGGELTDLDFFAGQVKFSDTSSTVRGNSLGHAIFDFGYDYAMPNNGIIVGAFAGYHYWQLKAAAFGARCNADDVGGTICGPPGMTVVPFDTSALVYEPTWQAVRIGIETRIRINDAFSVTGELALVPWAWLDIKDSHMLRQSPADLGLAPNVLSKSAYGYGGEAELFLNYAVSRDLEIGAGVRYWGLNTARGSVQFGPEFSVDYPLRKFDTQQYGMLLQLKGKM